MKYKKSKLLSATLLVALLIQLFCIPAFAATPVTNLIQNPGFEDKGASWSTGPTTSLYFAPVIPQDIGQQAYAGRYSAWPECTSPTGEILLYQTLRVEAGDYSLHSYVNPRFYGNTDRQDIFMRVKTSEGTYSTADLNYDTTKPRWASMALTFTVPYAQTITVSFQESGFSNFLVDEVSLIKTNVNYLKNPGFENGMTDWTTRGDPSAFITNAEKRSGSQSMYMGYFVNEELRNYVEQEYLNPKTGTYIFTAWIKTEATLTGAGAILFLDAKDANGNVLSTAASAAVSDSQGEWKQLRVSLYTPEGTKSITAKIGGVYCTGSFYVDDVQLSM